MGKMGAPSSWKIVKLVFLRKQDAEPKRGISKLEGHRADIGDVDVVRVLYYSASGKEKFESWKRLHVGGGWRNKLPALASFNDISATKALGMTGGKGSRAEAWKCGAPNNVFGRHGHQDRVRWGKSEACMPHKLWKAMTPMDGFSQLSCARWLGLKAKQCSIAWKTISHVIDVSVVEASMFPDRGKNMATQQLANVEEIWARKRMEILLDSEW